MPSAWATITSRAPSRFRSARATALGIELCWFRLKDRCEVNTPLPSPRIVRTVAEVAEATTRSGTPSRSRSPTAMAIGTSERSVSIGGPKLPPRSLPRKPRPVPSRTFSRPEVWASSRSGRPSRLTSASAAATVTPPVENGGNTPSVVPMPTLTSSVSTATASTNPSNRGMSRLKLAMSARKMATG